MALPLRTLFDPTSNQADLAVRKLFAAHVGRRHPKTGIARSHTFVDLTLRRIARDDRLAALAQLDFRALFDVEPQFGLSIRGIGSVAGVTLVGKDGADIAVEFNRWFFGARESSAEHNQCDEKT